MITRLSSATHPPPLLLQTPPRGLWMTVSRGDSLDIVCNVFLNCPPSVPPTALSGSRQGSSAKCVDRRRSKCEERERGVSDKEFLSELELSSDQEAP